MTVLVTTVTKSLQTGQIFCNYMNTASSTLTETRHNPSGQTPHQLWQALKHQRYLRDRDHINFSATMKKILEVV